MAIKNTIKRKAPLATITGNVPPRQHIWEAIRHQSASEGRVSMQGIQNTLDRNEMPESRISDYMRSLIAGGFLVRTNPEARPAKRAEYRLARDVGVEAPRVRRDGTLPPPPGREQIWRTLKIIGDCTARELADAASTPHVAIAEATASEYLRFLASANYVAIVRPGSPGVLTRYRLLPTRWTGPLAPMIQRTKQLYDPNTGEVVYSRVTKTDGGEP